MALLYVLPDFGEGVAEAEILEWRVEQGERIEEDAPMLEVSTAKATVEIPAPCSGVMLRQLVEPGDKVPVGRLLAVIGEPDEDVDALLAGAANDRGPAHDPAPSPPPSPAERRGSAPGRVRILPRLRRLAAQLGVSLEQLGGPEPVTEDRIRQLARACGPALPRPPAEGVRARVPLTGIRHTAAVHLTAAQAVPAVTVIEEARLDTLHLLGQLLGIGHLPFLIQASIAAFEEVPELNAIFDEARQELVTYERVDMAIAVHTKEGLAVPVVRDCGGLSLHELETAVLGLGAQARDKTLDPRASMGGTFTITSPGDLGVLMGTPLLNVPQVAILGLHRPTRRPIVVDDALTVGLAAHLSLTHDHRAIDGLTACRFVRRVAQRLSEPLAALQDGVFRPGRPEPEAAASPPAAPAAAPAAPASDGSSPASAEPGSLGHELREMDPRRRRPHLERYLERSLGELIDSPRRVDGRATWKDLGVDSLVAVKLRDRVSAAMGIRLPATILFRVPTPAAFAEHLLSRLDQASTPPTSAPEDPAEFLASLQGLPERIARERIAERIATGDPRS